MIDKSFLKKEKDFFLNYQKNHRVKNKEDIVSILKKDLVRKEDFLDLFFFSDDNILELLAKKSKYITEKFFGKVILLYTPLYISNYCENRCIYCGYSKLNTKLLRKKLSLEEIDSEMKFLKSKGFDTILILTGDDRENSPIEYIVESVSLAKKYFSEIFIESYAMDFEEYKFLVDRGLTGVTIYQETYDEKLYDETHLSGPKKDFYFRIQSPERAIISGVKEINIGCLLGLKKDFLEDVYMTISHADYLQKNYPQVEVSVSFPRIQPAEGVKKDVYYEVSDKDFVKIICLTRIFLPRVGINISTREKSYIRDNMIGLGITKMSAGSKTTVGGYYLKNKDVGQFEVNDDREVEEIIKVITSKNYRPEFTNWVRI